MTNPWYIYPLSVCDIGKPTSRSEQSIPKGEGFGSPLRDHLPCGPAPYLVNNSTRLAMNTSWYQAVLAYLDIATAEWSRITNGEKDSQFASSLL